jgi:hypothetical protein
MGASAGLNKLIGDGSGWGGGVAQPTRPVTDLSAHVDGGTQLPSGGNATANAQSVKVMHVMAAIVLVALALLWLSGALVFRGARLP